MQILKVFILSALLFDIKRGAYSQRVLENSVNERVDTSSVNNFNESFKSFFQDSYHKYFSKACDTYSVLIKFKLNKEGEISNLEYEGIPKYLEEFIVDFMRKANRKWKLSFVNKENLQEMQMSMPVFFNFTDNCPSNFSTKRTTKSLLLDLKKQILRDGFLIQKENQDSVLLWPVVCDGHFIHRNAFDPYYKSD